MTYFMVDVESDGPCPGEYSMVSFGAVVVEPGLARGFRASLRPVSEKVGGRRIESERTFSRRNGWIRRAGGGYEIIRGLDSTGN